MYTASESGAENRPVSRYFRRMRIASETVMVLITAEIAITKVIMVSSDGISPACDQQAGDRFRDPMRSQSPAPIRAKTLTEL